MTFRVYVVAGVPFQVRGNYALAGIEAREFYKEGAADSGVWDSNTYDLTEFGLPFIALTAKPAFNAATQKCVEVTPMQINGAWTQQWSVVNLTQQEIDAAYQATVPKSVTMRQARLALLAAGLLPTVNAAVANMAGTAGDAARITWEFSSSVDRADPLIGALSAALGLTSQQIDGLFIAAALL